MNILLFFIYVLLDVIIFPNRDKIPVLFWSIIYKGRKLYPLYRLCQFIFFGYSLYQLYPSKIQIAAFVIAFILLTPDLFYYLFEAVYKKRVFSNLEFLELVKYDVYWLSNFWQIGFIIFRDGFNFSYFLLSSLCGLGGLIISNCI